MPAKTKSAMSRKITLSLRQDVPDALYEVVAKDITPSKNALVEEAAKDPLLRVHAVFGYLEDDSARQRVQEAIRVHLDLE